MSTVHNREKFLTNIARKLGRNQPAHNVERPLLKHRCHHAVMEEFSQDQLKEVFRSYAESTLGARVVETSKAQLEEVLCELCHDYCRDEQGTEIVGETIISASENLLNLIQPENLSSEWHSVYIWDQSKGYEANINRAERAKLGIVMAEQALAESGTIVLYSQPKQGRAISLLPEASVFIVAKSALVPRMTQATDVLHKKAQQGERIPSCVNFISGPSSTADIELIKVVGVHGPVSASYIIVDDI